ncbi:hypothetical protein I7I53_10891 [Histoplasma capsulatum var. duboisii H88]|uniref:Uncharacterized protein n=1 Tax=Ajellomyces capsulatus (strain H88) TaxID=544711 RepID=A0A8A1LC65_AJEC8|nr:hypothetical protein I7I53_10891 [Histoplasma capsulatum var. duboisii H88]
MSVILKSYPLSANLPPLPPIQAEPSQNIELVMLANPFQHSALIQDGERHLQGQSPLSRKSRFEASRVDSRHFPLTHITHSLPPSLTPFYARGRGRIPGYEAENQRKASNTTPAIVFLFLYPEARKSSLAVPERRCRQLTAKFRKELESQKAKKQRGEGGGKEEKKLCVFINSSSLFASVYKQTGASVNGSSYT